MKTIKHKIENSPMFRMVTMMGGVCIALASMGTILIWFGNTTFASNKTVSDLTERANKMERVYIADVGNTRTEISIIKQTQKYHNEKLDDLKRSDEKQEKLH